MSEIIKGTLCHNGHRMQATFESWYDIHEDGSYSQYGEADEPSRVYCSEDCEDIPQDILDAAEQLFYAVRTS